MHGHRASFDLDRVRLLAPQRSAGKSLAERSQRRDRRAWRVALRPEASATPGRVVQRFREQATTVLQHPLLQFDAAARDQIAAAFEEVIAGERYTCYACAIMPDHVHVLIRKHKHLAEAMMEKLKDASRTRLIETGHRAADHPTWTSGTGWKVFLETPEDIRRTIRYIERNPIPLGLPVQRRTFVSQYDGWPLHKRPGRAHR